MKNFEVPKNTNTKAQWTRAREGGKARGGIETEEKMREQEKEEREKNQQRFQNGNKGDYWEKKCFQWG